MRLFVAVLVPDDLRPALAAAQERLRAAGAAVKWVAPGNFHFTLKFLGEVPDGRVQDIEAALAKIQPGFGAITLTLRGLGAFPTTRRPRVLWAGVTAGAEPMQRLAGGVEQALTPLGFAREARPFSAHLTIGRVEQPTPDLTARLEREQATEFGAMAVLSFCLVRSMLRPSGPEYTVVTQFALAGGEER